MCNITIIITIVSTCVVIIIIIIMVIAIIIFGPSSFSSSFTSVSACLWCTQKGKETEAIIIIIMIIIAFKGAIRDFLQSPHSAANCLQHVCSIGLGATMCKSRATHRALITCKCHVTCHLVRKDSSAIKFDRVEIAFIWVLFYWLNHLTDEGGEETGVPGENPWRRASENATYYRPKIQAPSETQTRAVALVAG